MRLGEFLVYYNIPIVDILINTDVSDCFPEQRWKIRSSWSITCWTRWMRWSSAVEWPSPSWKSSTTWRWGGSGSLDQSHSLPVTPLHTVNVLSCLRPTLVRRQRALAALITVETVVKLLCSVSLKKKVGFLPSRLTSATIFTDKLTFKQPVHSNIYFFSQLYSEINEARANQCRFLDFQIPKKSIESLYLLLFFCEFYLKSGKGFSFSILWQL